MRTLTVYINDTEIGILSEGNDLWNFTYNDNWISKKESFDLSPVLKRSQRVHQDGGSIRSVQWYFDNLLPEEILRESILKEANIKGDDAFALIEYLGAESAGSLILLPPGQNLPMRGSFRELPDQELCKRIQNLPRATLSSGSPKRMSAAGAQNKLLIIYRQGMIYEPVGGEPSTHILKPNHMSEDYPASVINEYLVMKLAFKLKLDVPVVYRKYTPEPVYIIERFDRYIDQGKNTQRHHIIDACQLLNQSRVFKYKSATLETLAKIVMQCRNKITTRLQLYAWLVFNLLIANNDNHLKNLSFIVSDEGIELSPFYDLLSTGAYHTKALANERANWPYVDLAISLPNASTFADVTRESVLEAGIILGLTRTICQRELDRFIRLLPQAFDEICTTIETENSKLPAENQIFLTGEVRFMRTLKYVVIPDMLSRVSK